MKIILPISQATFGKFKLEAVTKAPDDYYHQPHARSSNTICLQELDADKRQSFLNLYAFVQDEANFPFNICYKVADNTWGEKAHLVPTQNRDLSIMSKWGYFIDHARQTYAYRTCRGNIWGVFKNAQGQYFAFFDGARSLVSAMPAFGTKCQENTPILLETNAPKGMKWYETQSDYLIRMGADHTARFLAKGGFALDGENERDAFIHFQRQDADFENKIYAHMFAHGAENHILRKYRNRAVRPDQFKGADAVAWGLLSPAVQNRILRWAA